jgi:phosphoribosylanthranilate isomerase
VKAKICGLARTEDVALAASLGADYLGFILVPDTPRFRTPEEVRALTTAALGVPVVGVFPTMDPGQILEQADAAGLGVIQLHGDVTPAEALRLRDGASRELWKVLRVRGDEDLLAAAAPWDGIVDLLVLDAWHPVHLGGTGSRFLWDGLEAVRDAWPETLGLGIAGGLNPALVAEAMARLRPDLLDVSSGVERSPGQKDPALLQAFLVEAGRQPRTL